MKDIKLGHRFSHYYYGQYYAAQAMRLRGGEDWNAWYATIRDMLVARQNPLGILVRQHRQRLRHGDGPDHPPDAQERIAPVPG